MAANLEDQLIDRVRALPPDKQQEALRLLDSLAKSPSSEGTGVDRKPVWAVVNEINASLPQTLGRTYQPTARSIWTITSTERRSVSRDNVLANKCSIQRKTKTVIEETLRRITVNPEIFGGTPIIRNHWAI